MLTNPWNEPILVVDENPQESSLLGQALSGIRAEGRIVMLKSCQEAMSYIKGVPPYDDRAEHPFPLVIYIGLNMPDVNGMEFLKWVKANSHCCVIPTVILASNFENEDVRDVYQLGANAFLAMPSTLEDLTQVIRRSMEFWRLCQKPRYVEKC